MTAWTAMCMWMNRWAVGRPAAAAAKHANTGGRKEQGSGEGRSRLNQAPESSRDARRFLWPGLGPPGYSVHLRCKLCCIPAAPQQHDWPFAYTLPWNTLLKVRCLTCCHLPWTCAHLCWLQHLGLASASSARTWPGSPCCGRSVPPAAHAPFHTVHSTIHEARHT